MNQEFKSFNNEQQKILMQLGLSNRQGENWDAETFYESYVKLSQELRVEKSRLDKLTQYYADAFHMKKDRQETDYEDAFSMSPPKTMDHLDWTPEQGLDSDEIIGGANTAFEMQIATRESNTLSSYATLDGVQYGPAKMYRIQPNQFVFFPYDKLNDFDVIGSEAFSSCTAVIVKTEKGIFFSHVTTDWIGVELMVDNLRKILGDAVPIHLVRPKWEDEGGQNEQLAANYEERWQKTINKLGDVTVTTYPYIATGSKRNQDIHETSVLVTDDTIRTVGYYISPKKRDYNIETSIDTAI